MNTLTQIRFIWKPAVFFACLLPALQAVGDAFGVTGDLGANPVEALQDHFGNWGLRFVLIALAVTPVRQITGRNWVTRFRRMLGLFAFFYVLMHFLVWLLLDQSLNLSAIGADIFERPFITIGFAAFLLLSAMAATSTNGMRRRLGRRWQQLHYSVYAVGILAVWHYWWQVKKDVTEPLIYATLLIILLGYRVVHHWRHVHDRKKKAGARIVTA
ncbi:MAG: sulfoxide reductase heme-binding subunit YedZ [Woeseia sp.]|nr:sulfoxide reductase heme-binding subunit YedZ [Woeseia sp.]